MCAGSFEEPQDSWRPSPPHPPAPAPCAVPRREPEQKDEPRRWDHDPHEMQTEDRQAEDEQERRQVRGVDAGGRFTEEWTMRVFAFALATAQRTPRAAAVLR